MQMIPIHMIKICYLKLYNMEYKLKIFFLVSRGAELLRSGRMYINPNVFSEIFQVIHIYPFYDHRKHVQIVIFVQIVVE